jgi:spore maturation protein CgeB
VKRPRVLYVDALSWPLAQSSIQGICKAYEKVAELSTFDFRAGMPRQLDKRPAFVSAMNARLLKQAVEFKPDLVHLGKCDTVRGVTVAAIKEQTGAVVHHFYGDYRATVQPYVADIGQHADRTLLHHQDREVYKKHRQAGCRNVGFWWAGVDPRVFRPHDVATDYEVVMMANRFGSRMAAVRAGQADRYRFVLDLAESGISVTLFGRKNGKVASHHSNLHAHDFVDMEGFAMACSGARIALNYSTNRVYMYCSWRRIFNTMGAGCLLLTRYFPGLETVFENHKHLVWFEEDREGIELAYRYLEDDSARQYVAYTGRDEVLAKHTWDHRIQDMLEMAGLS